MLMGLFTAAGFWTWNRVDQNRRALLAEKAKEQEATRIEGLVGRLVSAEPTQIPDIVKQLDANPQLASTFLSPLVLQTATTQDEKRNQLHARLAMVSRDPSLVLPLAEELLSGKVTYVAPIRQELRPAAPQLTEKFRGSCATRKRTASGDSGRHWLWRIMSPSPKAASWTDQDLKLVAEQLVASNAEFQPLLRDALRPIRARLLGDLERIFADPRATEGQRLSAANAFADFAASDIARLSKLLTVATPEQFAVLYPIVSASPTQATVEQLGAIAATAPPLKLGSVERVPYGQRRANAAVTLLRLGEREKVLPVFEVTDDPEALTQFIFRCRGRGVGVDSLLDCLGIVSDGPVERYPRNTRYALLLRWGSIHSRRFPNRAGLRSLGNWPAGTAMIRVREYTVPQVGCCGSGGRRRSCARWIRSRCRTRAGPGVVHAGDHGHAGSAGEAESGAVEKQCQTEIRATEIDRSEHVRGAGREGQTRTTRPSIAAQDVLLHLCRIPSGRLRHRIGQ